MNDPSLAAIGLTHIGFSSEKNEDRFFIQDLQDDGTILAVADGLGGNVSGDYAADCIINQLALVNQIEAGAELTTLLAIVNTLDCNLNGQKEYSPKLAGSGSTLVCALYRDNTIYWIHVGDSRLYLLRDGRLTQITEDQTLARFLIEEGELAFEDSTTHYSTNVMDQFVGCGYAIPETGSFSVRSGDTIVLTTDGLHKPLTPDVLETILGSAQNISQKAERLIDAALKKGGHDNMTIVVAKI